MQFDVRQFSHDKAGKSFCAEASDLRDNNTGFDCGDRYLGLVHFKPNGLTCALFNRTDRVLDEENDILYWTFAPTDDTIDRYPGLKGYSITVFND